MLNESKVTIKQVFDSFDKNKSGHIEVKELYAVAQELGQTLTEAEVNKLIQAVDINHDGQISFSEFWDWWQFGKNGKLEELVFLKLKLMKLVKNVNSEFTRHGKILFQKYEGQEKTYTYLCFNHGQTFGHVRLKTTLSINGGGIQEELNEFEKYGLTEQELFNIVIVLKCIKPAEVVVLLRKWWEDFVAFDKEQETMTFSELFENLDIDFRTCDQEVIIDMKIKHPMMTGIIESSIRPSMQMFGSELSMKIEYNFGIKNGLKKLIQKNLPFVSYILEGFIYEIKASQNLSFNKQHGQTLLHLLTGRFMPMDLSGDPEDGVPSFVYFGSLFKGGKVHIQFREVDDVVNLFKGMGWQGLLQQQPTGRELAADLIPRSILPQFRMPNTIHSKFYDLIQILSKYVIANGNLFIVAPYFFLNIQFALDGLAEFVNYVFTELDETKNQQQAGA